MFRMGKVWGYLVECHVVLDVVCLFFGFGVVPGDVCDGLAVDVSVVVRGGSESRTSWLAYQMAA